MDDKIRSSAPSMMLYQKVLRGVPFDIEGGIKVFLEKNVYLLLRLKNKFKKLKKNPILLHNLTAHNWQKRKSKLLTYPCHKIYGEEAVVWKSSSYT